MDTSCKTPKNLRVAWIIDFATAVHLTPLLEPLIEPFGRQGVDFFLLCQQELPHLKNAPPLLRDYRQLGSIFEHHGLPREISDISDKISAAGIDVLHAFGNKPSTLASEISQRTGVPYIVSCMSLGAGLKAWRSDPQLIAVLPSSNIIRQDLLTRKVAAESKIILLRVGVTPADTPKTLVKHDGLTAILADGRNCDKDGLRNALRAFSEARTLNGSCAFFLVTPPRYEKNLRRLVDELGLQHDLTFIVSRPDSSPAKIIPSVDLFISLGIKDTLDVNPLLAMASGTPVIAAKGSPCDFLIDKTTALLFDPVEATNLPATLIETITNQSETNGRSAKALQYVKEKHDQLKCLRDWVNFYRKAAKN